MVGKYQSTLAGDESLRVVNIRLSLHPSTGQFWVITPIGPNETSAWHQVIDHSSPRFRSSVWKAYFALDVDLKSFASPVTLLFVESGKPARIPACRVASLSPVFYYPLPLHRLERYHHGAGLQFIQIIRPSLHHLPTFFKVRCAVIRPSIRVPDSMGKLMLDNVRPDV
jgi:hypothetical protein